MENGLSLFSCFNLHHSLDLLSRRQINKIEIGDIFFLENRICYFMQIVSIGDNLHEMSNPVLWEKSEKIFQNVIC